jgi:ribosomal protein L11 methyltransferase
VHYPALDVRGDADLLYAVLDDFSPTAIEERGDGLRAFFISSVARDGARAALSSRFKVSAIDVSDEDWARRSQEGLRPVTVGRITIQPGLGIRDSGFVEPHHDAAIKSGLVGSRSDDAIAIVIRPSMGFGTGHHATTRLCLEALQVFDVSGRTVLDIGTGSGVLAIAADRLGAARVTGIDVDPDAIQSARENLPLNPDVRAVAFAISDVGVEPSPASDVVTANLTGALLVRSARAIIAATKPGGILIVSGLLDDERDEVCHAFAGATGMAVEWERHEDGWTGLAMRKPRRD